MGSLEGFAAPENSVFLRWADLSDAETGFLLERREAEGEYLTLATVPADTVSYTDTGLSPETGYTYRVTSQIPGLSPPSATVSVSLPERWAVPRARPVLDPAGDGSVALSFAGADAHYIVEKSDDLDDWEPLRPPFSLGRFESYSVDTGAGDAGAFFRVHSHAWERPRQIGLDRPFEVPPEPDGEPWNVTDFGASPIVTTNDDAIGIKVALDLAEAGDVVFIPEGTYTLRQVLEIPNGVTLRGAGMDQTLLVTEGIDRAILVQPLQHDIRLEHFAITYLGDTEELEFGVYIGSVRRGDNSYRIRIDSLRIERFAVHGVSLRDCHHVLVKDCLIRNATNLGGGGRGYGVALNYPDNHNNWITGNTIGPVVRHAVLLQYFAHHNLVEHNLALENSEDAFDLHGEDEYLNELRHNTARDGARDGFGVGNTGSTHDRSGPNNWIHHNIVENSLAGIEVIQDSDLVFVDDNTFTGNTYGIRVHNLGGSHLYFRGNTIRGNEVGVSLSDARTVRILGNHFEDQSETAIEILSGVEDLVEEGNTFSGNSRDRSP